MKYLLKNCFILSLFLILASACSEDDEKTTDIRDQAVGTYNYTMEFAYVENGEIIPFEDDEDDERTGTFIVSKNPNDDKKIDFSEGGKIAFSASKIAAAKNGFTFDVPSQTVNDKEMGTITISGFEMFQLETTLYNGIYWASDKKFQVAFQTTYQGHTILIGIEAVKAK